MCTGSCPCRPRLRHEPPELNYDEYELYINLQSTFKDNNGKLRYPATVQPAKVKPKEDNPQQGISEKVKIEDAKPEVKPAVVPEVAQKMNPIGKDHIVWKTRSVDLWMEMDLLTDHRMWSENVRRKCGNAADEAFYNCLEDELALDLAEVTADGREHFRGSEDDPEAKKIAQARLVREVEMEDKLTRLSIMRQTLEHYVREARRRKREAPRLGI